MYIIVQGFMSYGVGGIVDIILSSKLKGLKGRKSHSLQLQFTQAALATFCAVQARLMNMMRGDYTLYHRLGIQIGRYYRPISVMRRIIIYQKQMIDLSLVAVGCQDNKARVLIT